MQHTQDKIGKLARITEDAKWTNYNTPTATLPAGSIVRITSWRPEGFNVVVEKSNSDRIANGEYFFIFKEYVKTAQEMRRPETADIEKIVDELTEYWTQKGETLFIDPKWQIDSITSIVARRLMNKWNSNKA